MMISLRMWFLLPLAGLFFLFITPTITEVVDKMSDCQEFFLENNSPQVPGILENGQIKDQNQYKIICQTHDNKRRFVTLYDTQNKIPVFSAYKYRGAASGRPKTPWKIEPQLDGEEDKNMKKCNKPVYEHQASDDEYKLMPGEVAKYDRGHLFPSSYGFDESDKISTFTLTNVVPQAKSFNQGSWKKMEEYIKCILENFCKNNNKVIEGYVVTGAKPGRDKLKSVTVPLVLGSAFCCYSHQNTKWIAGAFWGENKPDTPNMPMTTLAKLLPHLDAFPGTKCPLKETAEESLKELIPQTCEYLPKKAKKP